MYSFHWIWKLALSYLKLVAHEHSGVCQTVSVPFAATSLNNYTSISVLQIHAAVAFHAMQVSQNLYSVIYWHQ